jgi:hypothetical protein
VVYQEQQAGKQLGKQLHRSPPGTSFDKQIIPQAAGGVQSALRPGSGPKGKKGFPGKETAGFLPLEVRLKIPNMFG